MSKNILILLFTAKFVGPKFLDKLFWPLVIISLFCVYFFRDPVRTTPVGENLIISPADGVVSKIDRDISFPSELNTENLKGTRISIFLNVFNVHVNRVPVGGIVTKSVYRPGKFFNASLDKASDDNERQSVLVSTVDGKEVAFVQIAGLIARRIVCHLKEDDHVKAGSRYGIIKFSSRMDVYLPEGVEPTVLVGQTVVGGETLIAKLDGDQVEVKGTKD